jgi:GH24 family phage-related lysozyme (muramidase)
MAILGALTIVSALSFGLVKKASADSLMDPNSVYNGSSYVSGDAGLAYTRKLARTNRAKPTVSRKYYRHQRVRSAVAKTVQKLDPTPAAHPRYYLSPTGLAFIKQHEGLVLYVYDDLRESAGEWNCKRPVGTLTIGYGHTADAAGKFDFKCGARIDDLQAEDLLVADLKEVEDQVNAALKRPVTQGQYDAIVSITFNCGRNGLNPVVSRVNRGQTIAAGRTLRSICTTSKGKRLKGLVNRRNAEYAMWNTPPAATLASDVIVSGASAPVSIINAFRRFLGTNPTKRSALWCADAQNLALEKAGYAGTKSSAASSFKDFGYDGSGNPGDIALLQFGRTKNYADHVGTVTGRCSKDKIRLISGNDRGLVRERCVSEKYVVDYRTVALPIYASYEN